MLERMHLSPIQENSSGDYYEENEGFEYKSEFQQVAKLALQRLEYRRGSAMTGLMRIYADREQATNSGKKLRLEALESMGPKGESSIVLLATDTTTNTLAGIRVATINAERLPEGVIEQKATGEIATNRGGEGVASMVDTVFGEILQKVANETKEQMTALPLPIRETRLIWEVRNSSKERLDVARIEAGVVPEGEKKTFLEKEIARREKEQERWLSLYGENGKFGLLPADDPSAPEKGIVFKKEFRPSEPTSEEEDNKYLAPERYEEILEILKEASQ